MIVVIGGTGNTGRALVKALSAKGLDFKCLVRDMDKARADAVAAAEAAFAAAAAEEDP